MTTYRRRRFRVVPAVFAVLAMTPMALAHAGTAIVLPNDVNGHNEHPGTIPYTERCATYVSGAETVGRNINPAGYDWVVTGDSPSAAAAAIDGLWIQDISSNTPVILDMETRVPYVDFIPSIDHEPVPEEAIEATVYASNDPTLPLSSWAVGDISNIWLQGYHSGVIYDDYATRWHFDNKYRYFAVHWGGPKAMIADSDVEFDAVCYPTVPPKGNQAPT